MSFQKLFDKLGLRGARWTWRATRWDNRLQRWKNLFRSEREQMGYKHKFCPSCGALINRSEKTCSHCNARTEAWETQVAGRVLYRFLPQQFPVTGALIGVNLLIFVLGLMTGDEDAFVMAPESFRFLAMIPPAFTGGEFWRVITYGYLHHGAMHVLFNVFALLFAGRLVEPEIGSAKFFCVYTVSLIGGGLLTALAGTPHQVMAGASGAVFGLLGFGTAFGHRYGGARGTMLRDFFLRWIFIATIYSVVVAHVSHTGHIGGLVPGAAMGWWLAGRPARLKPRVLLWNRAARGALVLTVGAFLWALARLLLARQSF